MSFQCDALPKTPTSLTCEYVKDTSVVDVVHPRLAYVTGLGYFEFYVNGQRIGEDVLVHDLWTIQSIARRHASPVLS